MLTMLTLAISHSKHFWQFKVNSVTLRCNGVDINCPDRANWLSFSAALVGWLKDLLPPHPHFLHSFYDPLQSHRPEDVSLLSSRGPRRMIAMLLLRIRSGGGYVYKNQQRVGNQRPEARWVKSLGTQGQLGSTL